MAPPTTKKRRAAVVVGRLAEEYPGSAAELCALDRANPFQLLVATILSAQTTDERVNMVTPALFGRYPEPGDLAGADPGELEGIIKSTGFFHNKARSLLGMAGALVDRFDGEVPTKMEDLVTLPGVGRKTANVVLSVGFDLPGLPVDTHVGRLSRLLGLTSATNPVVVESELCALVPPLEWGTLSTRLILHGRRVCIARRPRCDVCVLADVCPSAFSFFGPKKAPVGAKKSPGRAVKGATVAEAPTKVPASKKAARKSRPPRRPPG